MGVGNLNYTYHLIWLKTDIYSTNRVVCKKMFLVGYDIYDTAIAKRSGKVPVYCGPDATQTLSVVWIQKYGLEKVDPSSPEAIYPCNADKVGRSNH